MKRQQIQQQEQTTAFQKQTTHNMLLMTLEWLEKYIEVAYPNYEIRKQIHDGNIKRTDIDGNPAMAEDSLATQLVLFRSTLRTKPPFLREEIKEEYYKWISATGINANNCPERLKHFLFGIHEIVEGRGEKILEDLKNEQANINSTSLEFMEGMQKLFTYSHSESKKVEKVEKSLEGKTYKDIEIESKFGGGNIESGGQTFQQIAGTVSSSYEAGFHFFPQQGQQSNSPQQRTNSEIIQDVRQNPRNWRRDEVITEYDNFGNAVKSELAFIHNSAEVGFNGAVYNWQQPIYLLQRFNQAELAEICQALGISQSSSSTQYYQGNQLVSEEVDNSVTPNSSSGLGTVAIIGGILALASLGIYGIVKKTKKIKK